MCNCTAGSFHLCNSPSNSSLTYCPSKKRVRFFAIMKNVHCLIGVLREQSQNFRPAFFAEIPDERHKLRIFLRFNPRKIASRLAHPAFLAINANLRSDIQKENGITMLQPPFHGGKVVAVDNPFRLFEHIRKPLHEHIPVNGGLVGVPVQIVQMKEGDAGFLMPRFGKHAFSASGAGRLPATGARRTPDPPAHPAPRAA